MLSGQSHEQTEIRQWECGAPEERDYSHACAITSLHINHIYNVVNRKQVSWENSTE